MVGRPDICGFGRCAAVRQELDRKDVVRSFERDLRKLRERVPQCPESDGVRRALGSCGVGHRLEGPHALGPDGDVRNAALHVWDLQAVLVEGPCSFCMGSRYCQPGLDEAVVQVDGASGG